MKMSIAELNVDILLHSLMGEYTAEKVKNF